jgi:thioredoxin-dependent peroxiredoxin
MPSKLSGNGALAAGAKAPAFTLESDAGATVKLSDFKGKILVLYFYPRDSTPGCTREAHDFSAAAKKLAKLGASVIGVSKDSVASHCKFRDKEGITFPLLSDTNLDAHKAYGVWGDKMMYGKKITGTLRSTFVIGPDGKVAKSFSPVKVDGHADAVLAAVQELASGG